MNDAVRQHVFDLGAVGRHMRSGDMGFERLQARPFFNDDEGILAIFGLQPAGIVDVDSRTIFDAAVLGMDGRDIGVERFQHFAAHPGFCGDDGNDVDHRHRKASF